MTIGEIEALRIAESVCSDEGWDRGRWQLQKYRESREIQLVALVGDGVGTRRYRTPGAVLYEQVAEIVRTERANARDEGRRARPRIEIMKRMDCSGRTASRYISAAGRAGHLADV